MTRPALNKSALHKLKASVAALQSYVPALDLKRRGLLAARAEEARRLAALNTVQAAHLDGVGERLPMLAQSAIALEARLPRLQPVFAEETVLGVRLDRLDGFAGPAPWTEPHVAPHWVEAALSEAKRAAERAVSIAVGEGRLQAFDRAIAKVSQRLNLLEKVLIPDARAQIRAIEIRLADQERAGVVIAKIAKRKKAQPSPP